MAKTDVNGMSYAELIELETKLASLKAEKQSQERASIKEKLTAMAKQAGFDIHDLFGRGRGGKGGKVAPKYRNPKNPCRNLDGAWTDAPLDGGCHKGQQGQARRIPDQVGRLLGTASSLPAFRNQVQGARGSPRLSKRRAGQSRAAFHFFERRRLDRCASITVTTWPLTPTDPHSTGASLNRRIPETTGTRRSQGDTRVARSAAMANFARRDCGPRPA